MVKPRERALKQFKSPVLSVLTRDTNYNYTLSDGPECAFHTQGQETKSGQSALQEGRQGNNTWPDLAALPSVRVVIHEVVPELAYCCLGNSTESSLTGISLLCARGCKIALDALLC